VSEEPINPTDQSRDLPEGTSEKPPGGQAETASAPASVAETPAPAAPPTPELAEPEPAAGETVETELGTEPLAEEPAEPETKTEAVAEEPAEPETKTEAEAAPQEPKSENKDWYILKVQSSREESIREGLLRRVAIAGLEPFFGDVIVPSETVTEFKGGKKRVTKRKLYPGYLVVNMEINDDTWFLVRETPGIGDFTGAAGHPTPMLPHEVSRILAKHEEKAEKAPKLKIGFSPGDQVKINDGTFESFEGEVEHIDETNGRVTVMINIFGRSTPVELEYWQIEAV